jgi:uncharacterized coiled-coil protein SlyX
MQHWLNFRGMYLNSGNKISTLNQTLHEQQTIIQQHQGQIPALNHTLQEQPTIILQIP